MRKVFVGASHIISPLGNGTSKNVLEVSRGNSGIHLIEDKLLLPEAFFGAKIERDGVDVLFNKIGNVNEYTFLEKLMLLSLYQVIQKENIEITDRTGLFISTTKGNIDMLASDAKFPKERAYLSELGNKIQLFFGFKNEAVIVSNACVSGILTLAIAKRMIQQGTYDNAFVVSGDILSKFVLSGFASFQAMSHEVCKPFSKNRTGINLGEAAAAVFVTSSIDEIKEFPIEILGDGSCNDANHISGPSRTGEGLYKSMQAAFNEAQVTKESVGYVSAHGTATNYNDEMEAIALNRMGMTNVPVNSLKGYFGHTLGAAGLLEAIIGFNTLKNNELYASLGFDEIGVSKPIQIIKTNIKKEVHTFLKTASGFGGCNTAVLFKKVKV